MSKANTLLNSIDSQVSAKFYGIQRILKDGSVLVDDLGSIVPASIMLHDMEELQPTMVNYMNNWGCEHLGTSIEELNTLGSNYYSKYFINEEVCAALDGVGNYILAADFDKQYSFFQRVKLYEVQDYKWFYSVCKVVEIKKKNETSQKLIILSSPVEGVDLVISRVNKVLDQDVYIKNNYKIFACLTKREKTIIAMVANGKSSKEIAEELFISIHTVHTHRKNIIQKTDCQSFANLLKFAVAFELF